MSRDKRRRLKSHYYAPGRTLSVNVVGVVAVDVKDEKRVEEEEGQEEETKGKRILSWLEGQFGKVVAISFLGKSPDSRSANARPLSSVKNRKDDGGGQRRRVSSNSHPCLLPKAEEEVRAEALGDFCDFFRTFRKKNQRRSAYSLSSRVRRGWGEERKEFLTTPSRSSSLCLLPISHMSGIARSSQIRHPRQPSTLGRCNVCK